MIDKYLEYLKNYDGADVTIMEVCGSHTAAIAKSGIKSVISPKIHLVSGPGCPVCVSPSGYVDKLIAEVISRKLEDVAVKIYRHSI